MAQTITTVLNAPSMADTFGGQTKAMTGVLSQLQTQANTKAQIVSDRVNSENSERTQEMEKWNKVSSSISDASKQIDDAYYAVQSAASMMTSLETTLNQANLATSDADRAAYAKVFQSQVRAIISSLRDGRDSSPLLKPGGGPSATISYLTGINGAEQTEFGHDLMPSYTLSGNGTYWEMNSDRTALVRIENGETTSDVASLDSGLRLDQINGDGTINFTFAPTTAGAKPYTNMTLTKSGLPLSDAWLYNDLSTAEGRARALADIESTKGMLNVEASRIETISSMAQFYDNRAKAAVDDLTMKNAEAVATAQKELQDVQKYAQAQGEVLQNAIMKQAQINQYYYSQLFKTNNKLFDAIIKTTV